MSRTGGSAPTAQGARWWILALISLLMFGNYYVYDSIGPLADQLQSELGFSDTRIGALNAIYSLPNIVLVLVGGMVVDRFGASRVTLWTSAICFAGALLTAAWGSFPTMAAGRFLFGVGAETMLVATTAAIGLWFRQANLALAMALVLSIARAGSYAADVSPTWAGWLYAQGWQPPLFLAAALAGTSLLAAIAYRWLAVRRPAPRVAPATGAAQERFKWRELLRFSRSYWYVLALCVLFYAVILPFRSTFAIKYLQHAHGLDLQAASTLNSYVFLTAVFATPLFGWLADRYGRRGLLLVAGSLLLPLVFLLLGTGGGSLWLVTALLGVSYSLVPAVLWPAVALMVESGRLGTAYGLMFMLQNLGLTVFNLVAGALNDAAGASAANPAGYAPMLVFFGTAAGVGTLFALALWRHERGPGGHGLEAPARAS